MTTRPKQHELQFPLTPSQVEGLNEMLSTLFRAQAAQGTALALAAAADAGLPAAAIGWLHNDGADVLAWTTPSAADVGADASGTATAAVAAHAALTTTAHGLGASAFHPDAFFELAGVAAGLVSAHAALTTTAHGLGASAFHPDAFFELSGVAAGLIATHAALTTGVHGLAITAGQTLTVTAGGTLGSAAYTAASAYQPIDSQLTSIAALADAAGVLTNNGAGVLSWSAAGSGTVTGSGTTGTLAKFTAAGAIGDSVITEAGGIITAAPNLALLNAVNTFTASQNMTSAVPLLDLKDTATSGAGFAAAIRFRDSAGTVRGIIGHSITTAGEFEINHLSTAVLGFYTNNVKRWAIGATTGELVSAGAGASLGGTIFYKLYAHDGAGTPIGTYLGYDSGTSYGLIGASGGASGLGLTAGGFVQRWGINAAGDWTVGASSHIADSSGTPTPAHGSIVTGTDYAFIWDKAATSTSSVVITFGHTFTNAPVCTATPANNVVGPIIGLQTTTTTVTLNYTLSVLGTSYHVLCRGY